MSEDLGGDDGRPAKSEGAFRTISEVAEELDVPQHVLRFWETKFGQVRPLKRGGGRRYYRPEDVALLKRIRTLLYHDGMTIKGVQKVLRETPGQSAQAAEPQATDVETSGGIDRAEVNQVLAELVALRDDLRAALNAA